MSWPQEDGVQIIENSEGKRTTPSFVAFTEAVERSASYGALRVFCFLFQVMHQDTENCIQTVLSCFIYIYLYIIYIYIYISIYLYLYLYKIYNIQNLDLISPVDGIHMLSRIMSIISPCPFRGFPHRLNVWWAMQRRAKPPEILATRPGSR